MNEVLLKHLRTLKTDEERQLCYESLAFIGMKYFFSMHPFDSSIRLESVHSLARKNVLKLLIFFSLNDIINYVFVG